MKDGKANDNADNEDDSHDELMETLDTISSISEQLKSILDRLKKLNFKTRTTLDLKHSFFLDHVTNHAHNYAKFGP